MAYRAGEAIESPNYDGIKAALVSVRNQAIQFRTRFFCTRDALIGVFVD
ncbi:MAG TPA: hypothetical protein VNO32_15575 [Candidatus Acidoferrum sp.]|jgi:hypothetical protein|nr:hypothetical protein [Candidatus Acidoferrum sp.]